jgi:hypothetical protein
VPGAIRGTDAGKGKAQECFYLTCKGENADPTKQLRASSKDDGYDTGFRIVPTGRTRTVGKPPRTFERPIFKWQEWQCSERCGMIPAACESAGHRAGWHDVLVWEKMVHADCAQAAGFEVPGRRTTAHRGNRTVGVQHQLNKDAESALDALGRIMMDTEERPTGDQTTSDNGVA